LRALTLERFAWTPDGTFGRLSIEDVGGVWYTVENPWKGNAPRISCIPADLYNLELGRFHRGDYPAYGLLNVPNRSLIKIHIGNTCDDVTGCIAVGESRGYVDGRWAVTYSGRGFGAFMNAMGGEETATLWIKNYQGG
jgi:hypothetical protein